MRASRREPGFCRCCQLYRVLEKNLSPRYLLCSASHLDQKEERQPVFISALPPGGRGGRRRGFLLAAGGLPRPSGQPAPRIALPGPRRRARGDPASPRTGEAAAPQASCSDPVRGRRIVVKFLMKMNKAVQAKNFRKVRLTVGFLTGFSGLSSNPILYERNSAANVKHCPSCFSPFIQPLRPSALCISI